MSKEAKLQSQMVILHSQRRPEEKGLLWATLNRTLSLRDGQKQKAMGLQKGVSDLIYFKEDTFAAIEVKAPGEKHNTNHIKKQLEWGRKIEKQGGFYFITTSVDGFWSIIEGEPGMVGDVYFVSDIQKLIDKGMKTIIF
jgi:VRR-NUC domain